MRAASRARCCGAPVARVIGALVMASVFGGCGDGGPTPEQQAINTAITSTIDVSVTSTGFDPPVLTVERGSNVQFTVVDAARLTGVHDGETVFDSGAQNAGDRYTWRPADAGIVDVNAAMAAGPPGASPATAKVTVIEPTPKR
jgi:plastocyanin